MHVRAGRRTYCLVIIRELGPRLGNIGEDLAVGQVGVRMLNVFADLVLVEEIGRGRAFGRVRVPRLLFFRLPLAFFAVAVEGAVVGSGGIIVMIGLLRTTRPALYGWAIGGAGRKGGRLEVVEGDSRIRLGDGEDVLEVICKGVGLVRTLAESLGSVANAGDELWRPGDTTRAM